MLQEELSEAQSNVNTGSTEVEELKSQLECRTEQLSQQKQQQEDQAAEVKMTDLCTMSDAWSHWTYLGLIAG